MILPPEALPLLDAFAPAFTQPTSRRSRLLLVAANLTPVRQTGANLLHTVGRLAEGHHTEYQRALTRAHWSGLQLGCILASCLLERLVPEGPVLLVGDDSIDGRPGQHVSRRTRHRDSVRCWHANSAWMYGHRCIVLALLVRFPSAVHGGCPCSSTCNSPSRTTGDVAGRTTPWRSGKAA